MRALLLTVPGPVVAQVRMKNTATANQTTTPTTTEPKAAAKSKTVEVTIQIPKRLAKKLERAAKLIGISLSRLVEVKLSQV